MTRASRGAPMLVAGLSGSLTAEEVSRTLGEHGSDFVACFVGRRGRLLAPGGALRMSFRVFASGEVAWVYLADSSVGHRGVEACVLSRAERVRFPRPRGGGDAEFEWPFQIDPPDARSLPAVIDSSRIAKVLERRGPKVLERCRPEGSSAKYLVTAHVRRDGHVVHVGAAVNEQPAAESIDCVVHEITRWKLPPPPRRAKVTFELQ